MPAPPPPPGLWTSPQPTVSHSRGRRGWEEGRAASSVPVPSCGPASQTPAPQDQAKWQQGKGSGLGVPAGPREAQASEGRGPSRGHTASRSESLGCTPARPQHGRPGGRGRLSYSEPWGSGVVHPWTPEFASGAQNWPCPAPHPQAHTAPAPATVNDHGGGRRAHAAPRGSTGRTARQGLGRQAGCTPGDSPSPRPLYEHTRGQ